MIPDDVKLYLLQAAVAKARANGIKKEDIGKWLKENRTSIIKAASVDAAKIYEKYSDEKASEVISTGMAVNIWAKVHTDIAMDRLRRVIDA